MKQKDIAIIIVVAFVAGVISFFIASKIFVTPENRQQKVEVIDVLTDEFAKPDPRFFNAESINPAKHSGLEGTNQTPFNSTSQ